MGKIYALIYVGNESNRVYIRPRLTSLLRSEMDISMSLDCRNLKGTMISLACVFGDPASLIPEKPVIDLSAEDETDVAYLERTTPTTSQMGMSSSFCLATY
jgi:hypothetical protein